MKLFKNFTKIMYVTIFIGLVVALIYLALLQHGYINNKENYILSGTFFLLSIMSFMNCISILRRKDEIYIFGILLWGFDIEERKRKRIILLSFLSCIIFLFLSIITLNINFM